MTEEILITAALSFKSPADRAAFLEQACWGNPELLDRVEQRLQKQVTPVCPPDQPAIDGDHTIAEYTTDGEEDSPESDGIPAADAVASDSPSEQKILGKLGPYELLEDVGRGGMGLVVRARDPKLNRIVAVKLLAPALIMNPKAVQRFLREAQAAAMVRHDNVVTIYTVDEIENVPFLVMEFIEGQSLDKLIERRGPLSVEEVVRIGMQIAAGLAAAHKQKLVHRDVKPGNILLEEADGRVKISDFGLARAAADITLTQTGNIAGTPQYMSPEQAQGDPVDHRSDLFSLGSVMYAMCTGRAEFRAESAVAILRRVCDTSPPPVRDVNPDVPEWLIAIIDKLMAKRPADRFQTAAEVAELLGRHLAHVLPSPGMSLTVGDRTEELAPPSAFANDRLGTQPTLADQPAISVSPRRKLPVVVISIALMAVVAFAAWRFWPKTTKRDPKAGTTSSGTPLGSAGKSPADGDGHAALTPFEILTSPDWVWTEPESLGPAVNSAELDSEPVLSADGLVLIFVSKRPGGFGSTDLWQSTRASADAEWSPAINIDSPVNSSEMEFGPCLSPDALTLWFNSRLTGRQQIYKATRPDRGAPWSEPIRLGAEVNTESHTMHPEVLPDGRALLFTAWDRPGGVGGLDLWQSLRPDAQAAWSVGTNLGSIVNSKSDESTPHLTEDGLVLIFDSNRSGGQGNGDLWLSSRTSRDAAWSNPTNLGPTINTRGYDGGAFVTADGRTLLFHSEINAAGERGPGQLDLWLSRRVPRDKPKPELKPLTPAKPLTFQPAEQRLPAIPTAGIALGDLDKDGDLDLFFAGLHTSSAVWLNDGHGRFTDSGQVLGDNAGFAIALGDLDGDGDLDAFVCNTADQRNAIWINDGRGRFELSEQSFESGHFNDVALGDIDGDRDLDAVVANYKGAAQIWLNDGRANFTSRQEFAGEFSTGVSVGDLDRDGDLDFVLTRFRGDNRIFWNDGSGRFTEGDQSLRLEKSALVAVSDLDGDGDFDLFITTHAGDRVWFNDGRGHFQLDDQVLGDTASEAAFLADLDADGDVDAITVPGGFLEELPRFVWLNDGRGRFEPGPRLSAGKSQALAVGDLDGDGDPDVVFGNLRGPNEIWLNDSGQSTIP